ncbi:MAG: hypothetical protein Q8T03_12040 [Bacteroidota bacterium]|nr:hypothetical protein [Bacteroidota bacterium]
MSTSIAANKRKEKILALLKDAETKGDAKGSFIEGLKTTAAGVAGAFVGGAMGRPSLLVGIGSVMAGHYFGSGKLTSFGVGMMAMGGSKVVGVNGTPANGIEGVKDRMKAVASDLKHRLYLDKFSKSKKKADEGTSGLGDTGKVQYFKYPNASNELDMGSLDAIEQEILRKTDLEGQEVGNNEDVNGYEDVSGMVEKIY